MIYITSRRNQNDFLIHHGIKGQKWGVRRYQNEDGTLTEAGKKHYGKMSGERIYKELKKQVRDKREEVHGWSNRWLRNRYIGENSKRVEDIARSNREKWANSKEFKDWERELDSFENASYKKIDSGKMTIDEYDKKHDEIWDRRPAKTFNDTYYEYKYTNGKSVKYGYDYIHRGGADLTRAYLKDLGYDKETVELFLDKMLKVNRTLGDI